MTHTAHTTGIIDVGGGFRAIFGAGVEDRCLEEDVGFDHCYGISAGSANLASYLARQQGRAHTFYTQYAFRKEYASMENYITKRNFCDLDYVYGTLSNSDGENPLDYAAFSDNPATSPSWRQRRGRLVALLRQIGHASGRLHDTQGEFRGTGGMPAGGDRRRPVLRRWHRGPDSGAAGH